LEGLAPLAPQRLSVLECRGLVLAEDIATDDPIPPFANSAMDGYAVRSADTAAARVQSPVSLRLVAEIAAGAADIAALAPVHAAPIMTGAPVPDRADAVIPIEDAVVRNDSLVVSAPVEAGSFIRPAGDSSAAGEVLVRRGVPVRPGVAALCAAAGRSFILAHPRPSVALITTGDELVDPGEQLGPYRIYNSSAYGLAMQIEDAGGHVARRLHAADNRDAMRQAFDSCSDFDIIVTSGGVSVGEHDFVRNIVAEGGEIKFWRAAIRPGKPIAVGRYGRALFFGLPGNPVSTFVTFELFVRPALRKLLGLTDVSRPQLGARLAISVRHEPGRRSFQRAVVARGPSGLTVTACARQGAHQLGALAEANALLIVPEDVAEIAAGETAQVIMLD
jgi:molybdopterin molybdotransferase